MLKAAKRILRKIIRPPLHRLDVDLPHDVYGSAYGGWPLLRDATPKGALIYSFGVGEDISFDLAAIKRFGATVHAFDPTPISVAWINEQDLPGEFQFHQIGIAAEDGTAEFFPPAVSGFTSFSATPDPLQTAPQAVTAKVMCIGSIIEMLGGKAPDVLKMDIEGFEYDVVADLLAGSNRPGQVLIEFHHDMYGIPRSRTLEAVNALRSAGYSLFHVSDVGREYGFALRDDE